MLVPRASRECCSLFPEARALKVQRINSKMELESWTFRQLRIGVYSCLSWGSEWSCLVLECARESGTEWFACCCMQVNWWRTQNLATTRPRDVHDLGNQLPHLKSRWDGDTLTFISLTTCRPKLCSAQTQPNIEVYFKVWRQAAMPLPSSCLQSMALLQTKPVLEHRNSDICLVEGYIYFKPPWSVLK